MQTKGQSLYQRSEILWRLVLLLLPQKRTSSKVQTSICLGSLKWTYSTSFLLSFSSPWHSDTMWKWPAEEALYCYCGDLLHLHLRSGLVQRIYPCVLPWQRGTRYCPNRRQCFILSKGEDVTERSVHTNYDWLINFSFCILDFLPSPSNCSFRSRHMQMKFMKVRLL